MAEKEKTVLMIDPGSRAPATALAVRRNSPDVGQIFIAPGNAGTEFIGDATNIDVDINNHSQVVEAAKDLGVDLVVVMPEEPLVKGMVDALKAANVDAFGPTEAVAQIEGSKSFAMELLSFYGVPIPNFVVFENAQNAHEFVDHPPNWALNGVAVKPDGLTGGKGVIVAENAESAHEAIETIMEKKPFGSAGNKIVIQEKLKGREVSVMAIVSGQHLTILPATEDHKPIFDGDLGPNTGGMGAVAPHPLVTQSDMTIIENQFIKPILKGLRDQVGYFRGVLYPALFKTADGFKAIEVNCRPGGSEWEALLRLLNFDLYRAMKGGAFNYKVHKGTAISVALTSAGYPGSYEKGKVVYGLDKTYEGVEIYHAGTARKGEHIVTAGGRVVFISSLGNDIDEATERANNAIGEDGVHFDGMHYRADIGRRNG